MNDGSSAMTRLYFHRPTPEYAQAFDLASQKINHTNGPVLAVVSSDFHAVEWLKRCPVDMALAGTGNFSSENFIQQVEGWQWGALRNVMLSTSDQTYQTIVWAEPETDTAFRVAAEIRRMSEAQAELWVIATSSLRRFLPAWQCQDVPAVHPLSPGAVLRLLAKHGWKKTVMTTFHGPRSIVWGGLAQAAQHIGRPDWSDRCLFAMRETYREPGWMWPFAPLALIRARLD